MIEASATMSVGTLLRWAGSKRKQLHALRPFWHCSYKRYIEPFAGSACLFFSLQPKQAILADINRELIEMYGTVREHASEVFDRVTAIPRTAKVYYRHRADTPTRLGDVDRAVRFIYLNRNCFNGIYRTNLRGDFNVPFSNYRVGNFVSKEQFLASAELLWNSDLRAWDFGRTLRYAGKGDFVYLDPPYAVAARRVFREYGAHPFSAKDLDRLGVHLENISRRGADFVVSYADCREARCLAQKWNCYRLLVRRHVAGFSGSRKRTFELIITNIHRTESRVALSSKRERAYASNNKAIAD